MRRKLSIGFLIVGLLLLLSSAILGDDTHESVPSISTEGALLLEQGEGAGAEAVFFRIGHQLSQEDFVAAIYGNNRVHRMVALNAVGYLEDPWPVIPYLVSFLEAGERQAASAAGAALNAAFQRVFDLRNQPIMPLTNQVEQLIQMLEPIALGYSIEMDLRVLAIRTIETLANGSTASISFSRALLNDEADEIRRAALASVTVPLDEKMLLAVVNVATGDENFRIRATAVSIVCENVLSHNIVKPSADFKNLVKELLGQTQDATVFAPILGCISQFPYRYRSDLTDKILNCGNEKVIKYWKSLEE